MLILPKLKPLLHRASWSIGNNGGFLEISCSDNNGFLILSYFPESRVPLYIVVATATAAMAVAATTLEDDDEEEEAEAAAE